MKYTFGTDRQDASRLEEIAKVFNPLAIPLIQQYVAQPPKVAVDIGCGPGFTTDMLHHSANPQITYGLDNSSQFLAIAREQFPHCRFLEHDITSTPFPVTAEVMYVRSVLSHLPHPAEIVNAWITQLRVGGILIIEELEAVKTEVDIFNLYLSTNEALVKSQGACLFVGQELADGKYNGDLLLNDCTILPIPDNQAAKWFLPNTQTTWRNSEYILARFSLPEIESISEALLNLATSEGQSSHITWKMRRIVLKRK